MTSAKLAFLRPIAKRRQRRLLHHVLLGIAFAGSTVAVMQFFPRRDLISAVSIGTAYSGLFLLAATLLVGPWNTLRGRANPVSFDLRRDLGIWAGIAALVHTVVGLNVHLRGRPWLYFVDEHHRVRTSLFGVANYIGLAAALLFLLLLVISNDASLRRLGAGRWKSLQRWTYAAVALTAAHGVAFQRVEKRVLAFQVLMYAVFLAVLLLQMAGVIRRKQSAASH
jgi:sulfoxide reductase heme-binding subunit YedZ